MTEPVTYEMVTVTEDEARRLETEFLDGLDQAQDAFVEIMETNAWAALGHESFAAWWEGRVVPVMRALSMRPTREIAAKVIEQVRTEEAKLPPAQRRTQRELAELAGTSEWTVAGRKKQAQERPEPRLSSVPDLGPGLRESNPPDAQPEPEPLEPDPEPRAPIPYTGPPPPAPTRRQPVMLTLRTHTGEEVPYPKPQAKPTFNESTGDGISWAAWSWNPVTGCLHGCDYCYARAIIHRYADANPAGFTPLFHEERLDAPLNTTIPAGRRDDSHERCDDGECSICAYHRVFVCSMADLYGRWVPDEWIGRVHASMLAAPQWQYILLTKFPGRYVGLQLPPSAWVGTSVDEQKRVRLAQDAFAKMDGGMVKWLSLEPLREPLEFDDLSMFDWVVIGAQTATVQPEGPVEAFGPHYDWVQRITEQARAAGCRVHHKPNLTNGRPGMQMLNEYPASNRPAVRPAMTS